MNPGGLGRRYGVPSQYQDAGRSAAQQAADPRNPQFPTPGSTSTTAAAPQGGTPAAGISGHTDDTTTRQTGSRPGVAGSTSTGSGSGGGGTSGSGASGGGGGTGTTGTAGGAGGGGTPPSYGGSGGTWNSGYDSGWNFNDKVGGGWNQGYVPPNGVSTPWPTGPGAPHYYAPVGPQGNNGAYTGSTDPNTFMGGGNYLYDLDTNGFLQQANQVNFNKAENGAGGGQPYTQIDQGKYDAWLHQASDAYSQGKDAPPQDFWINPPDYADTSAFRASGGAGQYGGASVSPYSSSGATGAPPQGTSAGTAGGGGGGTSQMAEGGIVDKPTRAIIGEHGPEAVIPLNPGARARMTPGAMGGRMGSPMPHIGAGAPRPLAHKPHMRRYGVSAV